MICMRLRAVTFGRTDSGAPRAESLPGSVKSPYFTAPGTAYRMSAMRASARARPSPSMVSCAP